MTARLFFRYLLRTAGVVALSLFIAFIFLHVLFQPFQVSGRSMYPTLNERDCLLVDRVVYRLSSLQRGDIVILRSPQSGRYLVKRLAATPGDLVEIGADGALRINGKIVVTPSDEGAWPLPSPEKIRLGEGSYFCLGDNLSASEDSRAFGPVSSRDIYGRVLFRYYPIQAIASAKERQP
ncbi:MAG: signal peptidase I [Acidobacteria bacterium]|nr:signal peptidase I [Acidobacteriota bacterium]